MQLAAQFPKPEGPEAIIDVSQFEERQLTGAYGDTYPLIIRLECVSDKGKTETHQLQVCFPPFYCLIMPAGSGQCLPLCCIIQSN